VNLGIEWLLAMRNGACNPPPFLPLHACAQCVAQGDMLLRGVVQEIPELPASLAVAMSLSSAAAATAGSGPGVGGPTNTATDLRLLDVVRGFARAIVPAPGHPEQGPLYLPRGLFNALGRYTWHDPLHSPIRFQAYAALLPLVAALSRDPLPEHIEGLESNDVLYAGDPTYRPECVAFERLVVETAVGGLVELEEAAKSGDTAAKGALIPACTALLAVAPALLEVDPGALPALDKVVALLRIAAPDHPAIRDAAAAAGKVGLALKGVK
jgi:hypothetical protein